MKQKEEEILMNGINYSTSKNIEMPQNKQTSAIYLVKIQNNKKYLIKL